VTDISDDGGGTDLMNLTDMSKKSINSASQAVSLAHQTWPKRQFTGVCSLT
jgi:hypothetical protein